MSNRSRTFMHEQMWNPERLTLIDVRALRIGNVVWRVGRGEMRWFGEVSAVTACDGGSVTVAFVDRAAVTLDGSAAEWIIRNE